MGRTTRLAQRRVGLGLLHGSALTRPSESPSRPRPKRPLSARSGSSKTCAEMSSKAGQLQESWITTILSELSRLAPQSITADPDHLSEIACLRISIHRSNSLLSGKATRHLGLSMSLTVIKIPLLDSFSFFILALCLAT